jgi:hypothetical protein
MAFSGCSRPWEHAVPSGRIDDCSLVSAVSPLAVGCHQLDFRVSIDLPAAITRENDEREPPHLASPTRRPRSSRNRFLRRVLDSCLPWDSRTPLLRSTCARLLPDSRGNPSDRDDHATDVAFRPCGFSPLRRFAPMRRFQTYCSLVPDLGFATFHFDVHVADPRIDFGERRAPRSAFTPFEGLILVDSRTASLQPLPPCRSRFRPVQAPELAVIALAHDASRTLSVTPTMAFPPSPPSSSEPASV